MSGTYVFDKTVDTLQAALEHAYRLGAGGRPGPDRADAMRLVWQVVDIASEAIRKGVR